MGILLAITIVGLIGVSPLALDGFGGATARWERRSLIGQTYGAASAVLSVLALIGVVATLVFQARETKLAREEARRTAISDLLRMAMEDADLDECWGPVPADEDATIRRQMMYVNMIISEWQMSFETKALGETRLRAISSEMFHGRVGRAFWESARDVRLATSETRRARCFHQILDEEYRKAPEPSSPNGSPSRWTIQARWRSWMLVTGVLAGVVATVPVIRRVRRRTGAGGH